MIDYNEPGILLTADKMAAFLKKIQNVRSGEIVDPSNAKYRAYINYPPVLPSLFSSFHFWTDYTCMYIGRMQDLLDNAAYAKLRNMEMAMLPVAATDGMVTADVTYYGAVGDGCNDLALAYEFLRMFLTEEAQIGMNQDTVDPAYYLGWPVRATGDISALWETKLSYVVSYQADIDSWDMEKKDQYYECRRGILELSLTNNDLPILDVTVDKIQISIDLERELHRNVINALHDSISGEASGSDVEVLAAEWLDELYWHLMEG